jgi:hypothetical protein
MGTPKEYLTSNGSEKFNGPSVKPQFPNGPSVEPTFPNGPSVELPFPHGPKLNDSTNQGA